jgi:hypothetical protein
MAGGNEFLDQFSPDKAGRSRYKNSHFYLSLFRFAGARRSIAPKSCVSPLSNGDALRL